MPTRAVVLLSGGLDSMLAVRILQEQGIEIEALNFRTLFACCQDQAAQAARELDVRLTVVSEGDEYLNVIRAPRFGYGRGANPCVDCRIYMFQLAERFRQEVGAVLVASGEVVGQRPMSQKKRDLAVIADQSGLEDRLLRPLSALCLPPTAPEREGLVDRRRLFGFTGRSRKGLIRLAKELGLGRIPSPSTGCALTEPGFAGKVHDLVRRSPQGAAWDFELLKIGRHFRRDDSTKVVLGRREAENEQLARMFALPASPAAALVRPEDFIGPQALVIGQISDATLDFAGGLMLRYSKHAGASERRVTVETPARTWTMGVRPHVVAADAVAL